MKVLMVSYSVYEADGRVIRYAEALQQRGAQVDMLALSRPGGPFHEVVNGVNVYGIQGRTHNERSKFSYLFRILSFFFRAMWFVIKRERKTRYDLAHVHSVPDFLVYVAWLPKLHGAKIILDIHDLLPELYASKFNLDEKSLGYRLLRYIEKKSAAFADFVIAANDIWCDKLTSRSVSPDKCLALLNFPDRSIFRRRGRTRRDDKFVMLYPGTLNWHQGVDIAVRSFARIKDQAPNAEFHIYGVGPAQESLKQLAASLGLNGRVKFEGSRRLRDVATLMEDCDLGVVPKRNDPFGDEAFSTKILEFMAMGVPVVVSETKIDRYYFNDSLVRFFRAGDESSLAEAMLSAIQNEKLRDTLVRNASAFVEKFDWEHNKDRYLDLVDRLTDGERQHRAVPSNAEIPPYTFPDNPYLWSPEVMNNPLVEYFRCPDLPELVVTRPVSEDSGFFRFGEDLVCYGKCSGPGVSPTPSGDLYDALSGAAVSNGTMRLPFDLAQVVSSLRYERYVSPSANNGSSIDATLAAMYYLVRPVLPVAVRKHLQKIRLDGWDKLGFPHWPVDCTVDALFERLLLLVLRSKGVDSIPFIWFWPEGAASCAIVTHDVETAAGRDFSSALMDIDDSYGIKASFQVVPERRYDVPAAYLNSIRDRGFEVNVQDLNHDGRLFGERQEFLARAAKINKYGRQFKASGFRSAVLYRRQDWFNALEFAYDMSVPNVAHLDPQRGGCCTVMPYFVGGMLELPVTTTQDYSLFHILDDYSIDLWKRQIKLIMERHGLISFIIHPDYIVNRRERKVYEALLAHLAGLRAERNVWIPTPQEANSWWRVRKQMRLAKDGNGWHVEGPQKERARVAYASEKDGRLVFSLPS